MKPHRYRPGIVALWISSFFPGHVKYNISYLFSLLDSVVTETAIVACDIPEGYCNDLDVQRCNLLIYQTKRLCTANLIVTSHEAKHFPGCYLNRNHERMELDQYIGQLLFDHVLCGVLCSGDVTLRKAPDLWRKWNSGMGQGLHSLQARAVLINAGQANAATWLRLSYLQGEAGYQDVIDCVENLAKLLKLEPEDVLVESTGVIGQIIKKRLHNNNLHGFELRALSLIANSSSTTATVHKLRGRLVHMSADFARQVSLMLEENNGISGR
ncbi:hypothetical protein RIF29_20788 [Crotalaria pallida]|uniref:Uncharacterized protein n=1 Tax=Crotalaria pallida TaxID=3830 RepID=A0AAN9F3A0_CROPI